MIKCYRISVRRKFSQNDLTIELYGCNLECRHCCSAYGRAFPPKYIGVEQVAHRALSALKTRQPHLVRFTGGEFSLNGIEAIELYCRVAKLSNVRIVIETHLMWIEFFEEFSKIIQQKEIRPPTFIISVKHEDHVTKGQYSSESVVCNAKKLYELFPDSHIAHGFIGFKQCFREYLFSYFPELIPHEDKIYVEQEGQFKFEALSIPSGARNLYYFEQLVKKYHAGKRSRFQS